ncbi:hypothetical protein [Aridibaculum aurantiacum]|uniref:hypothetical protein n=1 Tax=Aridibaculum aurantiacum TaxID=2810307 RepID=UPI001A975A1A|nr:hypothetical protein [Aridibaculum aurantiacum]
MIRIFKKKVSVQLHLNKRKEGLLFGVQNFDGQLELCNSTVNVTEIGFLLFSIGIIVSDI